MMSYLVLSISFLASLKARFMSLTAWHPQSEEHPISPFLFFLIYKKTLRPRNRTIAEMTMISIGSTGKFLPVETFIVPADDNRGDGE